MTLNYEICNRAILIHLPSALSGKYRYKTRDNPMSFGESFAARTSDFNERVYLEWQIGYDTTLKDVQTGKKESRLTDLTFTGDNGKSKHPYELSELVYDAARIGLVSIEDLREQAAYLEGVSNFLSDRGITTQITGDETINSLDFKVMETILPTFFHVASPDGAQIEISIEKQQYATGVQPMVYFCIPVESFNNGSSFYGRPSSPGETLDYKIGPNNSVNLLNLVRAFGICSPAHNHDIRQILDGLIAKLSS